MKYFKTLLLVLVLFLPSVLLNQVYHIEISGTIDLGLPPYIERVIEDAEEAGAKAIVLEVNTFGGRVDAATEIKDILLNTDLLTLAYINKRAISAGALISISCKKIGMSPGGSIGATTVVSGEGEKAPEKSQSYMRAEMGSTAELNGRNRLIAEGMVDEDVEVPGLSEKGKLITLTVEDAIKWEMADFEAPTLTAFLDSLNLASEPVIRSKVNWAENVVRFLTGPMVSPLLISLGLLGLFFEIKSPGWGIPGTVGLVLLTLFFGSHYLVHLANLEEILLFALGLILLALEVFVIPGFGVAGIAGIIALLTAIYLSLIGAFKYVSVDDFSAAAAQLGGALLLTLIGAFTLARFIPKTGLWKKITLVGEQKKEEGFISSRDYSNYLDKEGIAVSNLRPAGVGLFDDERLDVVTEGSLIDQNSPIKIIRVEGYRLVVREIKKENE